MKYKFYLENGRVLCRIKDITNNIDFYVDSEEQLKILITKFANSDYKIKMTEEDMILIGKDFSVRLKSSDDLCETEILAPLYTSLNSTIEKKGYDDLSFNDKLNRKLSHKSHSYEISPLRKGIATALCAVNIALTLYTVLDADYRDSQLKKDDDHIPYNYTQEIKPENPPLDVSSIINPEVIEDFKNKETSALKTKIDGQDIDSIDTSSLEYKKLTTAPDCTGVFDYENRSNDDRTVITRNNYYEEYQRTGKKLGIDPEFLLMIGTQEKIYHSDIPDPEGGLGLMQIQHSIWVGKTVEYYELNEETGKFEKKQKTITMEEIQSVEGNIFTGGIICQIYCIISHYNTPVALQMYNMGDGSMKDILKIYGQTVGKTVEELFDDPSDIGWIEFRKLKPGDPKYIENVNRWSSNPYYIFTNVLTGEEISYQFSNHYIKSMNKAK